MLSPTAGAHLEALAQRAHALTLQHAGKAVFIFTPLYISNVCVNHCRYCAFAAQHRIHRRHLSLDEIRVEAERIAADGIRHLLVLTGEAPRKADLDYLEAAIRILAEHFSCIGIEIYPLTEDGYARLIGAGVDSLTLYQETYDRALYATLHAGGPKADFDFRLEAPERACRAHMRGVGVGALLGLADPRIESFLAGLHAGWLLQSFPETEVSMSLPRLRPFAGSFQPNFEVSDRLFVQLLTAFRIYQPRAGITVSTRESEAFRNHLLPLGVTRMSAGVSTAVGAHSEDVSTSQFDIADTRSVARMQADLRNMGYQPVMHDWNTRYLHAANV